MANGLKSKGFKEQVFPVARKLGTVLRYLWFRIDSSGAARGTELWGIKERAEGLKKYSDLGHPL